MAPKGKILVIRGGAIGDFILTLPAISALRRQFPDSHLEILGYRHIAQLALIGGLADKVQSIEAGALAGFFARNGELNADLSDYFSEFDIILSYLYDPDRIFQTNVARCTPGQFIMGPHRAEDKAGVHAAKVYLKPLERLAIFEADPVPQLRLEGPKNRCATVALHPGSGSARKNWPEAHWARLLARLHHETPLHLLVVGGEAEAERVQRLSAALPPTRTQVLLNRPLTELAGHLSRCVAFIGHDSGISHLAAAVGVPGLLLWGETAAQVWRPPSQQVRLLHASEGLARLVPDQVFDTLQEMASAS